MSINNVKYGFYMSINKDRIYDNSDFSRVFSAVINDGIFANIGEKFAVTPDSGMTVRVGTGRAWFEDTWTELDTAGFLTLNTITGNQSRIDAIVLTVDKIQRINSIGVIQGTPSLEPVRPSMASGTDGVFNHPLAFVMVPANAESITAANIEIAVPSTTPYVTGPMQVADMSYLYSQWQAQFTNWFNSVKDDLTEDQAGALWNKINELEEAGLEKLAVARLIDGVAFDGSKNVNHLAECGTASDVADKTATLNGYSLDRGSWAVVKFANTNSASLSSLRLSINNTDLKPLRHKGEILKDQIEAGLYFVVYDGTNYEIIGGGIGSSNSTTYDPNKVLMSNESGLPIASGVTSEELGYLSGMNANVKSSLDAKAPLASPEFTGTPTVAAATSGTKMLRNIQISTASPSGTVTNGTIWIKYKA